MSRATRTAELLAAAGLVPLEIAREQEKTRRASATSQALASLVPALIQGGVDIYGGVMNQQRQQANDAADLELRRDALDLKRTAAATPKAATVTPFAANKEARAAAEEARKSEAFAEKQRKASEGTEQERLTAVMNAPGGPLEGVNAGKGRGVSADELAQSSAKTGVAPELMLGRIDEQTDKEAAVVAKSKAQADERTARMKLAVDEAARKKANDAQRKLVNDAILQEKQAAANERAKGKPLPAEVATQRGLKVAGLNLVNQLRETKKKVGTGSIEGRANRAWSAVADSPDWAEFKLMSNALLRTVGRVLEGGKMAAGDEAAYNSFLNNPNDLDEKEYDRVVDGMEWILNNDLDAFDSNLQGYRLAGRPPRKAPKPTLDPSTKLAPAAPATSADDDAAELGFTIDGG